MRVTVFPGAAAFLPAASIALLTLATAAGATNFTVSNPNDSGAGSLRLAIEQANAAPGSHQILFQLQPSANTIRPLTPLPPVDGDISLVGLPFVFPPPTPLPDREAVIDGSLLSGPKIGLRLAGDNSAVSGLAFTNFRDGQGVGSPSLSRAPVPGSRRTTSAPTSPAWSRDRTTPGS